MCPFGPGATLTPGTSVGTRTTPSPAAAHVSIAAFFSFISGRPRSVSYTESSAASNCKNTDDTPESARERAKDASRARRRPFVLTWTRPPHAFAAIAAISGRSSRIVGSPPESWTLHRAAASTTRHIASISPIAGSSPNGPGASAKQTEQRRSHRIVTSRIAVQVPCR